MPQQAITLELDELDAEHVEQACFEAGAVSVVLTDCRDDAILEPAPGEVRLWPATRLQAVYTEPLTAETLAQLAIDIGCAPSRLQVSEIADRVWEREWLRDFQPMRFGERLWICPSHASVDDANAVVIKLDPGLAFGTGTHPTTRLCLEYLDARAARDAHSGSDTPLVIDYGCGSGVLAIAALRLGAAHAVAYDIDPQALTATLDNAFNGSTGLVQLNQNAGANSLMQNATALTRVENIKGAEQNRDAWAIAVNAGQVTGSGNHSTDVKHDAAANITGSFNGFSGAANVNQNAGANSLMQNSSALASITYCNCAIEDLSTTIAAAGNLGSVTGNHASASLGSAGVTMTNAFNGTTGVTQVSQNAGANSMMQNAVAIGAIYQRTN